MLTTDPDELCDYLADVMLRGAKSEDDVAIVAIAID